MKHTSAFRYAVTGCCQGVVGTLGGHLQGDEEEIGPSFGLAVADAGATGGPGMIGSALRGWWSVPGSEDIAGRAREAGVEGRDARGPDQGTDRLRSSRTGLPKSMFGRKSEGRNRRSSGRKRGQQPGHRARPDAAARARGKGEAVRSSGRGAGVFPSFLKHAATVDRMGQRVARSVEPGPAGSSRPGCRVPAFDRTSTEPKETADTPCSPPPNGNRAVCRTGRPGPRRCVRC